MNTDVQIKDDILAELSWDPEVDEAKVGVTVNHGAVTLAGHVPNYQQIAGAKRAAMRVTGVLAVVSNVEMHPDAQHRVTDEGLAERVANVLKWNVSIPGQVIQAAVKNGIVTLSGEVDFHHQREHVLRSIEHISGIVNVVNLIELTPRASVVDTRQSIVAALQRHANVEAARVNVMVRDNVVTLTGSVESLDEIDRVERAAWAATGVTRVENNLMIVR